MSTNMGKQSLSDLSASRIMAVIIGGFMAVIGAIALLVSVIMFATRESESTAKGVTSVLITLGIFGGGVYLCRLAFREGSIEARSGFAYYADKALALVFGLVFAGLGITRLALSVLMLIDGLAVPAGVTVLGGAMTAIGIVLLRKVF